MIYTKNQIITQLEMRIYNLEKYLKRANENYNEKYMECERLKDRIKDLLKNYNGLRKKHEKVKKMVIQKDI